MRIFAAMFVLVVIAATVIASSGQGAIFFEFLELIPGKDITGHYVLYALLGFSIAGCLIRSQKKIVSGNWKTVMAVLGVVVVGEEISQGFISSRSFSYSDMLASLLGLVSGALVARFFLPPKQSTESSDV